MRQRNVSNLFIFGIVAVVLVAAAGPADAGCKKLVPSGPYICADWITGSAVCDLLLKGFKGKIQEYGEISCAIYGTEPNFGEDSCVPETYVPSEAPDCYRKGNCTTFATVEPDGNGGVCNNNWTLLFTPEMFYGQVCVCPGGFDMAGTCCANEKRNGDYCRDANEVNGVFGVADCLTEYCTWDGEGNFFTDYSFDQEFPDPYDCNPIGGI